MALEGTLELRSHGNVDKPTKIRLSREASGALTVETSRFRSLTVLSGPVFQIRFPCTEITIKRAHGHSLMMRSAHSTKETYIEVLPHLAPQFVKSASVTPRAREQAPQAKTGSRLATIFSIVSVSGGQPTGFTASTVALRIRYVASAVRKICTL